MLTGRVFRTSVGKADFFKKLSEKNALKHIFGGGSNLLIRIFPSPGGRGQGRGK
jgi:hypothetical protein